MVNISWNHPHSALSLFLVDTPLLDLPCNCVLSWCNVSLPLQTLSPWWYDPGLIPDLAEHLVSIYKSTNEWVNKRMWVRQLYKRKARRTLGHPRMQTQCAGWKYQCRFGFDFKEEASEIRDVRKWIERPWEESNSLAPDMFRESNKPLHVQTV